MVKGNKAWFWPTWSLERATPPLFIFSTVKMNGGGLTLDHKDEQWRSKPNLCPHLVLLRSLTEGRARFVLVFSSISKVNGWQNSTLICSIFLKGLMTEFLSLISSSRKKPTIWKNCYKNYFFNLSSCILKLV